MSLQSAAHFSGNCKALKNTEVNVPAGP